MKNIVIALNTGIIVILSIILLIKTIIYILTVYVKINEHTPFSITLKYEALTFTIGALIAIEIYLITM